MAKAVPLKGEALLGDHVLRVNFDAWMAFETQEGRRLPEFLDDMAQGLGAHDLVTWLRAFLAESMTREQVVEIVKAEGYKESCDALGAAVDSFFAPMKETKEENPPKAE